VAELLIKLPKLTPVQAEIAASMARVNVVAGGVDSGKTTLAIDIVLASKRGAIHGNRVAVLLPNEEAVDAVKRRIYGMIEPLISPRSPIDRDRIVLTTGGVILLVPMDKPFRVWDQFSMVVVDDAVQIEHLASLWDEAVSGLLTRYRGQAWFFGKPRGMFNDFATLARIADEGRDGAVFHMRAEDNPHADQEAVERDRMVMKPEAFEQERNGAFVDGIELTDEQTIIGVDETFREWCLRLAASGLQVDDMPFELANRPAMWFVYDQIPSTIAEAFERMVVMMKCTQVGFTVMEMLAMIYMAIKFSPCKIGMYLPDMSLAGVKSSVRFMPILRTIPAAHKLLTTDSTTGSNKGEGNVLVRVMGRSRFHFMWTSGKGATESIPLDVLSLDEVQEMTKEQIEKTKERLSGSRIKFTLAGSTANWPDADIDWLYKQGTMHQFCTLCPSCGEHHALDSYFPACIKYDPEIRDYRYVCKSCGGWIDNPQAGKWEAQRGYWDMDKQRWVDEEGTPMTVSLHFPQFLSPTITARNIITKYHSADDLKNFWNRVLGKPYTDPSQVPVNLEMLNACAEEGARLGLQWLARASGSYMGIDQMGNYNVAIIAIRMPSGHMGIVHVEEILVAPTPENPEASPFDRCDELMALYGVAVCVVETLPNYNDAKRFANRHAGKVFLAGYADIKEDMMRWGDSKATNSERKTDEEDRDRYTVILDQYKCMQVAMKRIQNKVTVFPPPDGLKQEVLEKGTKGERVIIPLLRDRVFMHFTRTALIVEKDEEQKKYSRKVVKVGIDPHFSYAYMLLNVAWARAHGTAMFLFPDEAKPNVATANGGAVANSPVVSAIADQRAQVEQMGKCGGCEHFDPDNEWCVERDLAVRAQDIACYFFESKR
jgi:thymidine kinase